MHYINGVNLDTGKPVVIKISDKSYSNLQVRVDQLNLIKAISDFVEASKVYPPSELYFQSNKEKQERKCKLICEPLFTLEPVDSKSPAAILRNMWSSWRELEVIFSLGTKQMKQEVVEQYSSAFVDSVQAAIKVMEQTYKPDQALWEYYKGFTLKFQDIKSIVYDIKGSK